MIYLIRHGETEANIRHIYCGSTDLPLSSVGVEKLQERKYDVGDAEFITSGMLRTEQTLKLLFGDVNHKVDLRFREIDFGIFEMRSYYDLRDTPEYQEWLSGDNEANVCPGGESGRQMESRVMEAFGELQGRYLGAGRPDVVVVTHGGVIAAVMNNLFPDEGRLRFDWQPAPGRGYVVVDAEQYGEL